MASFRCLIQLILVLVTPVLAAPKKIYPRFTVPFRHVEVIQMRLSKEVNPKAVLDTRCIDRDAHIVFHDENAAELAICGGISGDVLKCEGSPVETTGQSGSAKFTLVPTDEGASINISKARCVRAARAVCPTGSFESTCIGGATWGNLDFWLESPVI